ncbi:MAG: hypothetical protein ACJ74D_08680 [Gaiellaceae bacterium]|jgi:hypothetical protein
MRRGLALLFACSCFLLLLTAAAAPAQRAAKADECTWGASSVVVEDVNGTLVQSEPETSGCIPR